MRIGVEQGAQELVGVLRFHVVRSQGGLWEVGKVVSDQDAGGGDGRQDVTVVRADRVRESEPPSQTLEQVAQDGAVQNAGVQDGRVMSPP